MKVLRGIVAVRGLVKGVACLYREKVEENIPHYGIEEQNVDNEILRLDEAYKKARDSINSMFQSSQKLAGNQSASEIIKVHQMILDDRKLYDNVVDLVKRRLVNAEHAASDVFGEYVKKLEGKNLHFAELTHDIIDVRNHLLSSFGGVSGHFECPVGERQPVIVVSKRLSPSMVLGIPAEHVLAFVTEEGGFTTHATILARSYGVPVIFGVDVEDNINCGDIVIVDASGGKVIITPDEKTDNYYLKKIEDVSRRQKICAVRKTEPPMTKKGKRITLKVNISMPGEMHLIEDFNYDGVGLLRTEFLFLGKDAPPTEKEQVKMYNHILEEARGKPVVVRLLDIGTDKLPSYLSLPEQTNPDLGIRGPRALDFFYDIYLTQMRALLESSSFGDLRVLYPMVSDISDVNSFKKVLDQAKSDLRKAKTKFIEDIKEGIMIETPSAALMADQLLENVDFANIGSNDLLQYTLAASRGNLLVEKRYHIVHPSLVKLIEIVAKAGNKHKKEVCLCGEIASFEEFYRLFLSLGLKSFSVAASKLDDIKCHLLYEKKPTQLLAKKYYDIPTKKDIDKFFKD